MDTNEEDGTIAEGMDEGEGERKEEEAAMDCRGAGKSPTMILGVYNRTDVCKLPTCSGQVACVSHTY